MRSFATLCAALRKTQIVMHCVALGAAVVGLVVNIGCIVPSYINRRLCCLTDWVCAAFVGFSGTLSLSETPVVSISST